MHLDRVVCRRRLGAADHGVLCTVHAQRGVDAVPVCFVVDGDAIAVPIDQVKAKRTTELQRSHNLAADTRATLLIERWDADDWSHLWWVRASLRHLDRSAVADRTRDRLSEMLRQKYVQYRQAVFADLLVFDVVSLTGWSATEETEV